MVAPKRKNAQKAKEAWLRHSRNLMQGMTRKIDGNIIRNAIKRRFYEDKLKESDHVRNEIYFRRARDIPEALIYCWFCGEYEATELKDERDLLQQCDALRRLHVLSDSQYEQFERLAAEYWALRAKHLKAYQEGQYS
jgi:hypothetical protein